MNEALQEAPVQIGEVLAGKYRVERVLGVGGMGVVVAATHLQLHETFALKFVLKSALHTPGAVERFLREARAAVKLKSEHVAKVKDVGTLESGAPFMVMEYLEGADLADVLSTEGPLPVHTAADYVLQACEALAEAHSLGIVHRDLKPQNLFLTRGLGGTPLIKVLDFGISKITQGAESGLTRTSSVMGSPLYMSPEQMRSTRNVDARTDLWALGVILFELVSGRVPFDAETMPELCLKVVQDPPQNLRALCPHIPEGFIAVIERCLQKDLAMRFADAAELATALEPFAPPSAGRSAERARLALSRISQPGVSAAIPAAAGASARLSSAGPVPVVNTSAAWGPSTNGGAPARSGGALWAIAGIALLVVAGAGAGAFVAARSAKGGATPPSAAATAAPPPTASALPAVTLATEPSATTPPPAAASAPPSSVASAPPSASAAKPAFDPRRPTAPIRPTAPRPVEDDIPSMRR